VSHSVQKHLAVTPTSYDVEIKRFVPGYDAMLDEVVSALEEHLPGGIGHVLDLGAGTGALTERIAARFPEVRLTLLDADAAMLKQAEVRLASIRPRLEFRQGSFGDALPACSAAVASLALHHLHARNAKRDAYRNILGALRPGGVLVNADATMPSAPALAEPLRRRWAAHLVEHGDSESEAFERFAQWATEDTYYSIQQELEMLSEAGFDQLDVRWRFGPTTVIVARRA
jgi:tRNA (cmo5U34)-methyltransferase